MSVLIAWEKNYSAYLNCDNKLIIWEDNEFGCFFRRLS
jgi:hypothetical protein